ncbi:MAG: FtsX-like permease family protein [Bacillota bacterium]|nr:FtsX-like permease family protein [Bacillota bacterium]
MFKLAVKYLKGNKKNTISIILGIALSVMFMFSLIQMGDSIIDKYKEFLVLGENQDIHVESLDKEKANLIYSSIKNGKGEKKVDTCSINEYIGDILFKEDSSLIGKLCAADQSAIKTINNIKVVQGKFPKKAYEICIEEGVNNKLKTPLKVGDKINLQIKDANNDIIEKQFIISGFVNDSRIQSMSSGQYSYVFTCFDTGSKIEKENEFALSDNSYSIDILVDKDNYNFNKVYNISNNIYPLINMNYNNISKNLAKDTKEEKDLYNKVNSQVKFNDDKEKAYNDKDGYSSGGGALKILALIISLGTMLLVYNSINLTVAERIKQYGALRCIGMSKKQLIKIIFYEILVISVIGIGLGIIFGILLNKAAGETIMSLTLMKKVTLLQKPITYISVIVLAFITIIAASLKIFFSISGFTPIKALNYCEASKFKLKKVKQMKIKNSKQMIELFSSRNILRNKTKSITVCISLCVCITLLMIITNGFLCINLPKKSIKTKFSNYEVSQKLVDLSEPAIPQKIVDNLSKLDKVKNVYAMNDGRSYYLSVNETNSNSIGFKVYNDALFQKLIDYNEELKGINYKSDDVVVLCNCNNKAKDKSLSSLGEDSVIEGIVMKPDSFFDPISNEVCKIKITKAINGHGFEQAGVYNNYNETYPYLIMNETLAKKTFGELRYTDIMINVNGEITSDFERNVSSTLESVKNVSCSSYDAGMKDDQKQLLGMIILAVYLIISTAIIGFFNMSNTIKANIINRSSENGMLRAIGMPNKILTNILCLENVKLSIIASIMGFIISMPIGIYISAIVADGVIKIHYIVYIVITLLSVSLSYFVSYFSVKRGFKKQIMSAIRERG